MRRRFLHIQTSCLTVRRLVLLWAASVLLAWAALIVGWLVAWEELADIAHQALLGVRTFDMVRDLELDVLAGRRADLMWQSTGQNRYRERRDACQAAAEQIAAGLDPYITSQQEGDLLADIHRCLRTLREQSASPSPVPLERVSQAADDLLASLSRFHEQNKNQMEESVRAARRMYRTVNWCLLTLLLGTAVPLLGGSIAVIHRAVRPALALTDVAGAFGRGELSARAPVLYDDEMGKLAKTFNSMADDICSRDRNRLDFIAMVVHDLKNPVRAVELASHMLRVRTGNEPECRLYFDAIDAETKQLRTIVRDLMDNIQVASGRFSVQKAPVCICAITRRVLQAEAQAFADHEIVMEVPDGCTVLGDARWIERVLMNLMSNAVKYSPRGTQVTIRVWKEEPFGVLSVSDQGPGIAAEDLEVIFQPFGRGRSAVAGAEGAGMGLYVVRQIIEAHGGRIEVRSEPGHGAEFRVLLPLVLGEPIGNFPRPDVSK